MKRFTLLCPIGACLFAFLLVSCGNDPSQPQSLEQQKAMVSGRAPTPEELKAAMAKLPKPPAQTPAPPPGTNHP